MQDMTVSGSYVGAFGDFLVGRGVPARSAYAIEAGRAPASVRAVRRIPYDSVWSLFERWSGEFDDGHLGLKFGAAIGGAGFGVLGVACASGETLADAIRALVTLEPIVSSVGRASVRMSGDEVELAWDEYAPGSTGSSHFADAVLAGWVSFGRYLAGMHVPLRGITLTRRASSQRATYEDTFDCPVRVGGERNTVSFDRDWLSLPMRYAHPEIHRALAQWGMSCARLAELGESPILESALDGTLDASGLGARGLTHVSIDLAIAPRSLQRRLAEHELSYRRMTDCVRLAVAVSELLESERSLLAIGGDAGFAEQASFSRAFRKWTGVSPTEFRRLFSRDYSTARPAAH